MRRATSTDGISFTNTGRVLDIGGAWQWVFESTYHEIGRADSGGWSANTKDDSRGYLTYGPYTTSIPVGWNTASCDLMVDNNTADDYDVVTLDVHDATSGQVLASRTVRRKEFPAKSQYAFFNVSFYLPVSNHSLAPVA